MDKYSVDRIEEDTIVLENIENNEIIEINKSELDFKVIDGNILKLVEPNLAFSSVHESISLYNL